MPEDSVHLVTGATGNVGREVVRALQLKGARIRAGGRGRPDDAGGVAWVPLDFNDPTTFAPALAGVDSLFLMRPPPVFRVGPTLNRFLDTAVAAGLRTCTFLSVAGAERNCFVPHRAVEDHLRNLPLLSTILRPGFFAQNFTGPYRTDICRGELVLPAGQAQVSFVDARDLGAAAANVMVAPKTHTGNAYTLTGPAAFGFAGAVAILSQMTGRTIRYRPVSPAAYFLRILRADRSVPRAAILTAIHAGLRDGSGATVTPHLPQLLGRAPHSLPDFFRANLELFRDGGR